MLKNRDTSFIQSFRIFEAKKIIKAQILHSKSKLKSASNVSNTIYKYDDKITSYISKCLHYLYILWDSMSIEAPQLPIVLKCGQKYLFYQQKIIKTTNKCNKLFGINKKLCDSLYGFFYYISEDKVFAYKLKDLANRALFDKSSQNDTPMIYVQDGLENGKLFKVNIPFYKLIGVSENSNEMSKSIKDYIYCTAQKHHSQVDIPAYVCHVSNFLIPVQLQMTQSQCTDECYAYRVKTWHNRKEVIAFIQTDTQGLIIGMNSSILNYIKRIKPQMYRHSFIGRLLPEVSLALLASLSTIDVYIKTKHYALSSEQNWAGYIVKFPPINTEAIITLFDKIPHTNSIPMSQFQYEPSHHAYMRNYNEQAYKLNEFSVVNDAPISIDSVKQTPIRATSMSTFSTIIYSKIADLNNVSPNEAQAFLNKYVYD